MIKQIIYSRVNTQAMKCLAIPLIALSQCVASYAHAEQNGARDTIYFTLPPSPEVLASHLFGEEQQRPLTRSISFKSSKTNTAHLSPEKERSVTMPILFHFGKTTITNASKPFLDNVGKMLASTSNGDRRLVVEGHTDAIGHAQYNQTLSEMRARAIKDYLVVNYGVDPNRLLPRGKGESALYNTTNPKSGENRRVEFLPLTSS